jgi:hypothetical protein
VRSNVRTSDIVVTVTVTSALNPVVRNGLRRAEVVISDGKPAKILLNELPIGKYDWAYKSVVAACQNLDSRWPKGFVDSNDSRVFKVQPIQDGYLVSRSANQGKVGEMSTYRIDRSFEKVVFTGGR